VHVFDLFVCDEPADPVDETYAVDPQRVKRRPLEDSVMGPRRCVAVQDDAGFFDRYLVRVDRGEKLRRLETESRRALGRFRVVGLLVAEATRSATGHVRLSHLRIGRTVNPRFPSTLTAPVFPPSKSPEPRPWPVANL
jgi:hypothetical protein